jgi:hypothetical protein
LRSSYSRTSQHCTKPECSLPCSQEPSPSLYPEPDESSLQPYPISLRSILILLTHYLLVFQVISSLLAYPPIYTCIALLPMRATLPANLIHLDVISVQVMKLLIMQFLRPRVTSSFFGPNILLKHPQCMFSLNVRDNLYTNTEPQIKLQFRMF